MDFDGEYGRLKGMVEAALAELFDSLRSEAPPRLVEAMEYSVRAGGKRLRPVLCLHACELSGGRAEQALGFACAYELIHTYSLIHDDLPSMDDDTMRRGLPTNHVVFGEAMAILAGDGLQALAFEVAVDRSLAAGVEPARVLRALREMALACGPRGMVGGQVLDVDERSFELCCEVHGGELLCFVEEMAHRKTGAMIRGALLSGAIVGGCDEGLYSTISSVGTYMGLCFQVVDDVLDEEGDPSSLGKSVGKDRRDGKLTFATLMGTDEARLYAFELYEQASLALEGLGERGWFLSALNEKLLRRSS